MNCRFYDSSAYNDCSEPAADRVVEKDKANFCDYFSAGAGGTVFSAGGTSRDGNNLVVRGIYNSINIS